MKKLVRTLLCAMLIMALTVPAFAAAGSAFTYQALTSKFTPSVTSGRQPPQAPTRDKATLVTGDEEIAAQASFYDWDECLYDCGLCEYTDDIVPYSGGYSGYGIGIGSGRGFVFHGHDLPIWAVTSSLLDEYRILTLNGNDVGRFFFCEMFYPGSNLYCILYYKSMLEDMAEVIAGYGGTGTGTVIGSIKPSIEIAHILSEEYKEISAKIISDIKDPYPFVAYDPWNNSVRIVSKNYYLPIQLADRSLIASPYWEVDTATAFTKDGWEIDSYTDQIAYLSLEYGALWKLTANGFTPVVSDFILEAPLSPAASLDKLVSNTISSARYALNALTNASRRTPKYYLNYNGRRLTLSRTAVKTTFKCEDLHDWQYYATPRTLDGIKGTVYLPAYRVCRICRQRCDDIDEDKVYKYIEALRKEQETTLRMKEAALQDELIVDELKEANVSKEIEIAERANVK